MEEGKDVRELFCSIFSQSSQGTECMSPDSRIGVIPIALQLFEVSWVGKELQTLKKEECFMC